MYTQSVDLTTQFYNEIVELRESNNTLKENMKKMEENMKKMEENMKILIILQERNDFIQQKTTQLEQKISELNKIMMKYFAYNKSPKLINDVSPTQQPSFIPFKMN